MKTVLFAFLMMFVILPAEAQQYSYLTEANISQFLKRTEDLINRDQKPQNLRLYMEQHIHNEANFDTTFHYHIPNFPVQTAKAQLNKDEYINTAMSGAEKTSGFGNKTEILSVYIIEGGKKAIVKTLSKSKAEGVDLPLNLPQSNMLMLGEATCDQTILLEKGFHKLKDIQCNSNIHFVAR